jgi:Flp pilus assembly protein TadG
VETIVTKAQLGRWLSQERGAQIAEFAAVLPMLVMLIFGILWFGRAFNIYTTVNHAARAAAEAAALHRCASCGNQSANNIETEVVDPILIAAHLDPAQKQNFAIVPVVVNPNTSPQLNGFRVHMSYPYNFKLNGLTCCPPALTPLTLGLVINAQAQAKEEN